MAAEQSVNPIMNAVPLILIFLIMYFIIIKPQRNEQKKKEAMRNDLKKNDQVVTAGGIHGKVSLIKDKTVVVRVDDNVKIELDKASISDVIQQTSKDK